MPLFTSILATVCVAAHVFAGVARLAYDRAYPQEWWRWVTASFAHYDATHLLTNLVAFVILGTLVERRRGALVLALLTALGASATLAWLHLLLPEYRTFAGLSAVSFALLGYLAGALSLAAPGTAGTVVTLAIVHQITVATGVADLSAADVRPVWQLHALAGAVGLVIGRIDARRAPGSWRRGWRSSVLRLP